MINKIDKIIGKFLKSYKEEKLLRIWKRIIEYWNSYRWLRSNVYKYVWKRFIEWARVKRREEEKRLLKDLLKKIYMTMIRGKLTKNDMKVTMRCSRILVLIYKER